MKKRIGILATLLSFTSLLIIAPVCGLALNSMNGAAVSGENRTLVPFPEIKSAGDLPEFPVRFTDWFSDHLFFKDTLVFVKSELEVHLFKELDSDRVIYGADGRLYNKSNDGQPLETFRHENRFTDEELEAAAGNIKALSDDLTSCGIRFVLLIAPDKEQIYGAGGLTDYKVKEGPGITEQFVSYMEKNCPDVKTVYPAERLREESRRREMYYASDTHWNEIGAETACEELLSAVDENFVPIQQEFVRSGDKYGDLQRLARLGSGHNSTTYASTAPATFTVMQKTEDRKTGETITEISNCGSEYVLNQKLYLTGDSFRWNLSPYLEENVRDCIITSRYYLDTDNVLSEQPDVFVYEIAERYLHDIDMLPGYNTAALK